MFECENYNRRVIKYIFEQMGTKFLVTWENFQWYELPHTRLKFLRTWIKFTQNISLTQPKLLIKDIVVRRTSPRKPIHTSLASLNNDEKNAPEIRIFRIIVTPRRVRISSYARYTSIIPEEIWDLVSRPEFSLRGITAHKTLPSPVSRYRQSKFVFRRFSVACSCASIRFGGDGGLV